MSQHLPRTTDSLGVAPSRVHLSASGKTHSAAQHGTALQTTSSLRTKKLNRGLTPVSTRDCRGVLILDSGLTES
jgi:hypothetical protein